MEYKGYLVSTDNYMNVQVWIASFITCLLVLTKIPFAQLANTEEYIDGAPSGHLGEVLIRCNNILYIRGIEEEEEDGEMRD